jgi:16S rRNA (cytosine967-C5)-methyltransferase
MLKPSGRLIASRALAKAAVEFPDITPDAVAPKGAPDHDQDGRLGLRIIRAGLRHWITIEYLLDHWLKQPLESLDPKLQGVFVAGGAQLLYLHDLPTHAIVDESVKIAGELVRPSARGLVNAVLRRLSEAIVERSEKPWVPADNTLPTPTGHLVLKENYLAELTPPILKTVVATSTPELLLTTWEASFGGAQMLDLAKHSVKTPPIIIAVEPSFDTTLSEPVKEPQWLPHAFPGFIVWTGHHAQMKDFLAGHPYRRVQDPASATVIESTRGLTPAPKTILDACAGRGTKTRQLAHLFPDALVYGAESDSARLESLRLSVKSVPNIKPLWYGNLAKTVPINSIDLLVLDVPCSNSGVLARRIEARYRYSTKSVDQLVELQRKIVREQAPLLAPGAHILYSTCSIDERENQAQARWLAETFRSTLIKEHTLLPAGDTTTYHDGGYHALLKRNENPPAHMPV